MGSQHVIGVDLGTTGTKAALFDLEGRLVSQAYEETRLLRPRPGWVEQDPEEMYASVLRTIRACLEQAGVRGGDVAAVALVGQMAGITAVDAQWRPAIPYDSWLDTRCAPYMREMQRHQRRILELSGGYPSYTHGPKILWWKHQHPDVFARIDKFVMPAAYAAGRMAGLRGDAAFMDYTYLHFTCLSDNPNLQWSEELCDLFGVPMEKLPRIVKPWDIIGHVGPEAARETGLLEGIPIAAGAGDTTAGVLGAGLVDPGGVLDVAGTAAVCAIGVHDFRPDVEHGTLFTARTVNEDMWYALAYINGGGLNVRWFRDQCAPPPPPGRRAYDWLDELAAQVAPGSDGLLFLPHLGGRVCPNDPALQGLWLGFTWNHGTAHFYRAILEAVAYEYAYYLRVEQAQFPDLEFQEVRIVGGGAASPVWKQIKADVLGLPYVDLNRSEGSVLGAAIIAGRAVGAFDDVKAAARRFVHATARTEPRPDLHRAYQPLVERYVRLLEQAGSLFAAVGEGSRP
ncbi:MAG TPA: FGGY family carbohydrate kinase [Limnochordales bacterium]|nr:FGGY family carbohydrate kinase [Limnochordales bacterium]